MLEVSEYELTKEEKMTLDGYAAQVDVEAGHALYFDGCEPKKLEAVRKYFATRHPRVKILKTSDIVRTH